MKFARSLQREIMEILFFLNIRVFCLYFLQDHLTDTSFFACKYLLLYSSHNVWKIKLDAFSNMLYLMN